MCLHRSFENLTLKVRYPWGKGEDLDIFCDGSRLHGCRGCFCRRPIISSYRTECQKCGALLFDLLDQLWEIRREIYLTPFLKELTWYQLFEIEWKIEEQVYDEIRARRLPEDMLRSKLVGEITRTAADVTKRIIRQEKDKRFPDCVNYRACKEYTETDSDSESTDSDSTAVGV